MNKLLNNILLCCTAFLGGCGPDLSTIKQNCVITDQVPTIQPDYANITIPPNIAPMNFSLQCSPSNSIAEIASINGPSITVRSKKQNAFFIDATQWKKLLSKNAGSPLRITIFSRDNHGVWHQYKSIENTIASEPVDRYCTYRLLNFQYNYWRDLSMCQRDLTSFKETTYLNSLNYTLNNMQSGKNAGNIGTDAQTSASRSTAKNNSPNDIHNEVFRCVNCHMLKENDPERFVLQLRSIAYGSETMLANGDSIITLSSRFGQAAWHPDGHIIAFSVYKVQQYFHAVGKQFIDVFDNTSRIVIYDVTKQKIIPVPQLTRQEMLDGWPAWSADGRYLYFCSAPVLWDDYNKEPPDNFNKTKYNLLRIAYDPVQNSWGIIDTMLSTTETGLSIALPRISPDNRFCLFCMQNYGAYPYTDVSSDLYLMDLTTRKYHKLPVNSDFNESWHSWSINGRWFLFSSKRGGGILTRLYLAYIDSSGNASKPFILPQHDPKFYDSFLKCYNVAEFAIAPVRFSERQLLNAIKSPVKISVPVP